MILKIHVNSYEIKSGLTERQKRSRGSFFIERDLKRKNYSSFQTKSTLAQI